VEASLLRILSSGVPQTVLAHEGKAKGPGTSFENPTTARRDEALAGLRSKNEGQLTA
jgi:hypothetical protein